MKTILTILITIILNTAFGQNPSIEVFFRFNEISDSIIRVKTRDYFPQDFSNVKKNLEYKYSFSGILGHQKVDTIQFLNSENKVMTIILKNDIQNKAHNTRLFLNIPKLIEGKFTVKIKELFEDSRFKNYTADSKFTWMTEIDKCFYDGNKEYKSAFVHLENNHPILSPSDTLYFMMNGKLRDDGNCSAKLFFEIFKPLKDSLVPILAFPGFTPDLCGMGFQTFDNRLHKLQSLYDKAHFYGSFIRANIDTGKYIFRFVEFDEKREYVFSDTIHYNTLIKVDKEKYTATDSIKISFNTIQGFGLLVEHCGPSIKYHINLEKFDEKSRTWQTLGFVLPPTRCLAIYRPLSGQSQHLELTVPIPYSQYKTDYSARFRISTVVYENQWKTEKINCTAKTIYSDEFTIE